jgi:4-hydroxy-tetrahydrodipicolinate reductase
MESGVIRVCLAGARGRMGRLLGGMLAGQDPDLRLVSALERPGHPELGSPIPPGVALTDDARQAIAAADVLLDFSLPEGTLQHLELAASLGVAAVTGTTGFDAAQQARLRALSARIPLVWSANMSRGVHVLRALARQAAAMLREADAEVFEIHHRHKADAPSGTARLLADDIRGARGGGEAVVARAGLRARGEVGLASARGGDVVGEHQVMFLSEGEQLVIVHRAGSREHFCRGALAAVRFVRGKAPGMYAMDAVFQEA